MSYARFIDNDVYVFLSVGDTAQPGGWLECCACWLGPKRWREPDRFITEGFWVTNSQRFTLTTAMLAHLDEHREAGHHVDDDVYVHLRDDQAENDATMNPSTL